MTLSPIPKKERQDLIKEIRFLRFAFRQRGIGNKPKIDDAIREISRKLNADDEARKEPSQR